MKRRILNNCLDIALKNNNALNHPQWDFYHHFSFIIQDSKIITFGTNRCSYPLTNFGYSKYTKMHSETDVYFKAKGIMEKNKPFSVVNIRLTKTSRVAMSQPCSCCVNFLSRMGCKDVWFTTNVNNFACIIF